MILQLSETPVKPIIIEGFPSFGMIGTIVTQYLIEHLDARKIGSVLVEEIAPMIAVHNEQIMDPIGIYFCEKHNIVILHITSNLTGIEWKFADCVLQLASQLNSWEIISIEGVFDSATSDQSKVLYFANNAYSKQKIGTKWEVLREGIILGVTGALLIKAPPSRQVLALFGTTHSQLPDSKAASAVISALDVYLGLSVDPAPLLQMAEEFEEKIKNILMSSQQTLEEKDKKNLSYVG